MQRATAHHLRREMAILVVVELMICFALTNILIQVANLSNSLPPAAVIRPHADILLTAILTFVIGGIIFATGLYNPEIYLNQKPSPIVTASAATIVFSVLFLVSHRSNDTQVSDHSIYIAEMMVAWFAAIALIGPLHGVAINRISARRRFLTDRTRSMDGVFFAWPQFGCGHILEPVLLPHDTMTWDTFCRHRVWGVVPASEPEASRGSKLRAARVLDSAAFNENDLGRIDRDARTGNDLPTSGGFDVSRISGIAKRLCDIIIGGCMLVLLLPLMAVTALATKIDSPGPVFHRQQRVGRLNRVFTLYTFRSMTADRAPSDPPSWLRRQDPYITRVGRFIRATRVDELPQLINVLSGQMSLIGPRPEPPHFVEQLARAIPLYRQRGHVRPGLTGWAQVSCPYGASVVDAREKLAHDLYYVKNRTVRLDILILISTIRVALFRQGAR